jgi:uncharacterized protein YcfL
MKHMRYIAGFMVFVFLGCAGGSAPNVLEVKPSGDKRVEINDTALAHKIAFGEVIRNPLASGLEAQVMLQNLTKRDVIFEYRFLWYDASGFELSSLTAWQPATLAAMEGKGFKSSAPSANAMDFKLMIRAPHPITDTNTTY